MCIRDSSYIGHLKLQELIVIGQRREMSFHKMISHLFLFGLICLSSAQAPKHVPLKLEGSNQFKSIEAPSKNYFSLDISKVPQENDVTIIARNKDFSATFNVYLSIEDQYPSRVNENSPSLMVCETFGYAVCLYPRERLKGQATLYVTVECEKNCAFDIKARPSISKNLKNNPYINSEHSIEFKDDGAQVLSLDIPDSPEAAIVVEVWPKNPEKLTDRIFFDVFRMNPSQLNKIKHPHVANAPREGKLAVVKESEFFPNEAFCTECNLTVVLRAQQDSSFTLRYYMKAEIAITNINDLPRYGVFYERPTMIQIDNIKYQGDAYNYDFYVSVIPYDNDMNIGFSTEQVSEPKNFRWQVKGVKRWTRLFIPSTVKESAENNTNEYFYWANSKPNLPSTPVWMLVEADPYHYRMQVTPKRDEAGVLRNGMIAQYIYRFQSCDTLKDITLEVQTGNASLIILLDPKEKNPMKDIFLGDRSWFTKDYIHDILTGNTQDQLFEEFLWDLSPSNMKFKQIQHSKEAKKICNMVVAVVANDSNEVETTYVLHVNEYNITESLKEGEVQGPYAIGVDEEIMFKFESTAIAAKLRGIQFNVRTVTGACKAMVSAVSDYPYFTFEHSFDGDGAWVEIPIVKGFNPGDENQKSRFNIVVKGWKSSCRFYIGALGVQMLCLLEYYSRHRFSLT
eukprot:TRINITY_DN3706_c0_g1_i1.p1 TRINITY_DN3706_c0_g1~~TRINITY_DN3706_c0_g1_i1.p1  ORF type:complete len:680 (-),score=132.06 TRINITY_DN3706_c0_g1_i1:128-2167(-)